MGAETSVAGAGTSKRGMDAGNVTTGSVKTPGSKGVRVDGLEKVTGRAVYAGDVSVPGMCHAVLLQSPVARGRIEAIDTKAAEESAGVLLVLTHRNRPALQPLPEEYTSAFPGETRTPLEDDVVHYAGQHVAVVVAETREQAEYAAGLISVTYCYERPALSARETEKEAYEPEHFAKNTSEALQSRRGRLETARAAQRIEVEYETPVEHHNPIELSSTVAAWEGNELTLYDSTRWMYGSRMFVATMLGIPQDRVRVVCPYVGGAFGSKGFLWQHVVLTALAAKLVGRPVALVVSRRQMFTSVGHRPQTVHAMKLGADGEGRLQMLEHAALSDTSPVAKFVEPSGMVSRNLYSCANVRIAHRVSRTNRSTPCFMRAPGEAPGSFALESAMDELAVQVGLDPLEFRLRNYAELDEEAKRPWSSKHLRECYEEGARRFGWERRKAKPGGMQRGDWALGWGMATASYPARRSQSTVRAELHRDGTAVFRTATQEIGTGTRTAIAQIAAETLGIPVERVRVEVGDTRFPPSPVHGASQATATVGPAVFRAASDLREQLVTLGLGRTAAQDLREVLAGMGPEMLQAEAEAKPGAEKETLTWNSFGAHFVELMVHRATGEVRVARWVGVFDAGRILNRELATAQIEGGIVFGIGMALMEETLYDPQLGAPLNASLGEYLVPSCADVPPTIDVSFVERPDVRFNPLGVRGLGELGVTGAAGAIANAYFHATGRRVRRLPITPVAAMTV